MAGGDTWLGNSTEIWQQQGTGIYKPFLALLYIGCSAEK